MCLKTPKPPKPPKVQAAPKRDVAADEISAERRRLDSAKGVYDNIFTSALGDSTYGTRAAKLATLGV